MFFLFRPFAHERQKIIINYLNKNDIEFKNTY